MPLIATRGAASAQGFGEFAQATAATYIEDVFSTYLYTGNGTSQTITNGIDLSTKGGLVWSKRRNVSLSNLLFDTVRGNTKYLLSNTTGAEGTDSPATYLTSFNNNGFSVGAAAATNNLNDTYVGWTFREQLKFFDVVTFTSSASGNKTFSHNLGAIPGCVIIKNTQTNDPWLVYHRSVGDNAYLSLNSTAAQDPLTGAFSATSTTFTISSSLMYNSQTYVAYLFAHDAGGFGLTGTDNVISCGSFTTDGSGYIPTVNLGYEPQWVLAKPSSGTGNWFIMDNMRGWYNQQADQGNALFPNTSGAEAVGYNAMIPTATGFTGPAVNFGAGITYIYIAIRRGPMKVPTSGASVFTPATRTGNGAITALTAAGFPPDLYWAKSTAAVRDHAIFDRLRGPLPLLSSNNTQNEIAYTDDLKSFDMTGVTTGTDGSTNAYNQNGVAYVNWYMRRAPSFFDEVCYTGNGATQNVTHNLGVVPELMIMKERSSPAGWWWNVYYGVSNKLLKLNTNDAETTSGGVWNSTLPTSSVFSIGAYNPINTSSSTYVAYLFATCAGVSKVGSYTGTATTLQVNCGFTAGSRFVLIKRTDSTGDWYVWDSARGIIAGNDPYLLLNTTAAEVTSTDYVDTYSAGFEISSTAPAAINASGGTYIFLAIA